VQLRYPLTMRRARFYLTLLALTLLPQVLAAGDLVRFLNARGVTWLSFSVFDARSFTCMS